jgi:two-component system, OmpR family, alkaline phosphatase synthesis response regulator PhoP
MPHKIVVVEDEELIRTMLRINLTRQGYQVDCFSSAETMLEKIGSAPYDILLLDIMLPGIHGDEALRRVRAKGINIPVLMLTAKKDLQSKVGALDSGADDYLPKPFDMDELLARVRSLIRRSQGERIVPSAQLFKLDRYEINFETNAAQTKEGEILLSDKESGILKLFAKNPGKMLGRQDILEEVWGLDVDPTPRTIDNFILRFRKLFEEDPENPKHFITIRSIGYRFDP